MPHCSVRSRTVTGNTRHQRDVSNRTSVATTLSLLCTLAVAGCKCESTNQRPFTPFGVATEVRPPEEPGGAPAPKDETRASEFARVSGQLINPPAHSVMVGDSEIRAPEGKLIAQYVVANLDASPGAEVVAWLVSEARGGGASDEPLVLIKADQPPKKLAPFPAFVPRSHDCTLSSTLDVTGPRTVTWDVRADCPEGSLIPRSPHRSVAIISPLHPSPLRLQLRLSEPAPGEVLELEVDTADIDSDDHDDAALTFSIHAQAETPAPNSQPVLPAEARLVWLDRAAGMARDYSEPRKSFTALGSLETVRAKGQNTSRQVGSRIQFARRLFAYVCKEASTYRLTDVDGTAISCGDLSAAMDAWTTAEVVASLTQHHYARAVLAYEQASWFGGGTTAKTNQNLVKSLRAAISSRSVNSDFLDVRATTPSPGPHYSPLRYVDEALFIGTPTGVRRFRDGTLTDASDEVDPWSLVAFGPAGQRLSQLAFPCNEALVFGSSQTNSGTYGTALTTDILSPRPGVCESRNSAPDIDFRPIAWAQEGLSAYIGPLAVGPAPRFRQPGSPQSTNGAFAITSGKLGLLVQSPAVAEFWAPTPEAEGLTDCVIANSGARAACLREGRVVVLTTSPSTTGAR